MIPTLLNMKNVTSYREESIDLNGVECASITGPNGAGKSTIIDGILLALFGEATKGGKQELGEYLPRDGRPEASIAMEFLLHGEAYRVERSIKQGKTGGCTTKVKLFQKEGEGWKDISAKNRETQASIERLLRVDYRTFTNSSIILQGQHDSFTREGVTASDRKKILCKILGLEIWDEAGDIAKKKREQVEKALLTTAGGEEQLVKTIETREAVLQREGEIDIRLEELTPEIGKVEDEIAGHQGKLGTKRDIDQFIREGEASIARERTKLNANEARIKQWNHVINQADLDIGKQQALLTRAEEINAAAQMEPGVRDEVEAWEKKASELSNARKELSQAELKKSEFERTREAQVSRLEANLKNAQGSSAVLEKVPCGDNLKAECPLLEMARKADASITDIESQIIDLKMQDNPHEKTCLELEARVKSIDYDEAEHRGVKRALEDTRQVSSLKPALEAAAQRVLDLQAKKVECGESIAEAKAHDQESENEIFRIQAKLREMETELKNFQPITEALTRAQAQLTTLRAEESRLMTEKGRIELSKEQIARAETQLEEMKQKTGTLQDELYVLQMCEKACSKVSGVPALIIENSIPQIEALTNSFLSGMQGGRFEVSLLSQIEGKTTGTYSDGFEIVVSDQGFDGALKTYSGAENFMINLALRVGTSKLISQRAGAEIGLFVIDEGLGKLDPANRKAVIEAIQAASAFFGKVLVITHIPELQDAFPQRIEVSRNGGGSKVKVVA